MKIVRFLAERLLLRRRAETNRATRSLQMQYAVALGLVACLTISSQLLLKQSLELKRCENAVIDALGNERLHAQRLVSATRGIQLAIEEGTAGDRTGRVSQAIDRWSTSHEALESLPGRPRYVREADPRAGAPL